MFIQLSEAQCVGRRRGRGFTLVELLVVIAVIGILSALLLPGLGRAKAKSRQVVCLSQLHQIDLSARIYLADNDDRFPDQRILKQELGYLPWTSWPKSDPRGGWAAWTLDQGDRSVWLCPGVAASVVLSRWPQSRQTVRREGKEVAVSYWLWRFDRIDDPVPLDNFWGKTIEQSLVDLQSSDNPAGRQATGLSAVEWIVDPYFPKSIAAVPEDMKGYAAHSRGRNALWLDGHARFVRDERLR